MKKFIVFIMIMMTVSICYADRVCLRKSDGKLIEHQSGDAPLGTLTRNAVGWGYDKNDIEEKYVTKEEWAVIMDVQITKPAEEALAKKEVERKAKEEKVKTKLGLSNKEFEELRDSLR